VSRAGKAVVRYYLPAFPHDRGAWLLRPLLFLQHREHAVRFGLEDGARVVLVSKSEVSRICAELDEELIAAGAAARRCRLPVCLVRRHRAPRGAAQPGGMHGPTVGLCSRSWKLEAA